MSALLYTPSFKENEFRHQTAHYKLDIAGQRILYAYIRKNACTAFKFLINRMLDPKFLDRTSIGLESNGSGDLRRKMRNLKHPENQDVDLQAFDHIIFIYRDPVDRFVSVFSNKFIDGDGKNGGAAGAKSKDSKRKGIKVDFQERYGKRASEASFEDFTRYAEEGFENLNCHLWPQKAHLLKVPYRPIALKSLKAEMSEIIGAAKAQEFFGLRVNASISDEAADDTPLSKLSVSELRELKTQGIKLKKENFITNDLRSFISEKYWQDYEMLKEIE